MSSTAGTAMGAALESAGYVAQNHVLTQLHPILIALAVLFFVIASMQAIWSMLVDGRALMPLLKVVSPAIVLFILSYRVDSNGVPWQYGETEAQRRAVVLEQTQFDVPTVQVSWLFNQFNSSVSGLIRTLTDLLTNDRVRDQVLFTNRQRITGVVLSSELVSPGLKSLIAQGLQGQCGLWLSAARRISRGNRDENYQGTPEYNAALVSYNALYTERVIRLPVGTPAVEYLRQLLPSMASAQIKGRNDEVLGVGPGAFADYYCGANADTSDGIANIDVALLDGPVSCEQIWCWTTMGVFAEAEGLLSLTLDATVGKQPVFGELPQAQKQALLKEVLQDIARKVSPPNDINGLNEEDPSILPIVIAGMLLRHELEKNPFANIQSDFAENSGVRVSTYKPYAEMDSDEKRALREHASSYERAFGYRTEIFSAAMAFPYFQGAILFVLALLFPFFSLLLLLPGRTSGFFLWCAAWLWVKSWDLGWAVVMTLDELLWDMMPHQAIYSPTTTGDHTPITMLESAFENDPTYNLVMYYTLVSVLMFAVPTILGQVILRSVSSAADVLSERFEWLNSRALSQFATDAARARPTEEQIIEFQQEYYSRVLDGLPNRWDLSQRRSPAVFTRAGIQTDVHSLLPQPQQRPTPAVQPRLLNVPQANAGGEKRDVVQGIPQELLDAFSQEENKIEPRSFVDEKQLFEKPEQKKLPQTSLTRGGQEVRNVNSE